ncbi:MAG: hypothetical protein HY751_09380 [Nitrospinae bacterium]|nr:hypothetical protein [Nitrospinota bacterium]
MTYSVFETISRRLGVLTKSLQYLADKELRGWLKDNEEYKKYKLSWWEAYFLSAEKHPFLSSLDIFLLYLFVTITTFFLDIYRELDFSSAFNTTLLTPSSSNQGSNAEILLSYFTGLWGVQAAIIGLVYPIAISLIAILLQREFRSDTYLRIYLTLSAARSSGSRSLALVILMGAQYLLILSAGTNLPFLWLVLDGLIFLENGAGAFWFLAKTFQFLSQTEQSKAVLRYGVGITWPKELNEQMLFTLFASAPSFKLLPVKAYGDNDTEKEPQVLCMPLGGEEGVTEVQKRFAHKKRFVDVRFSLLAYAVIRWRDRAHASAQGREDSSGNETNNPLLIFPLTVGEDYEKVVPICISRDAPGLDAWDRFIMKRALVFRRPTPPEFGADLTTFEIFDQYANELRFAVQDDRAGSFEKASDAMIDLFVSLIKTGDYKLDSGKWDNYTKLSDYRSFGQRTFYQKWLMFFRDPIKLAADSILKRKDFAISLANIPCQLANCLDIQRHSEVISNSYWLWDNLCYFVIERWAIAVEEQGEIKHDFTTPCRLRAPFQRSYQALVDGIYERWESLEFYLQPKKETDGWEELNTAGADLLPKHLDTLVRAFLAFAHTGDRTGAERMLDGILRWPDYRFQDEVFYNIYRVTHYQTLGLAVFTQEWIDIKPEYVRNDESFKIQVAPYTIFSMAMSNYWKDVCLITFGALLHWCATEGGPHAFPAELSKRIASGETPHPDDTNIRFLPFADAEGVLWAMLRQRMAHTSNSDPFSEKFGGLIKKIYSLDEPRHLSGRVYIPSSSDIRSLTGEILVALLLKAEKRQNNEPWSPSSNFLSDILNVVTTGRWDEATINGLLGEWIRKLEDEKFDRYQPVLLFLLAVNDEAVFKERREAVIKGLKLLSDRITYTRNQKILGANIDNALLKEIGLWASAGFSANGTHPRPLPLSFFKAFEETDNPLSDWTLRITKVNKARYTSPRFEDPPSNEKEWFADTIEKHVAIRVLNIVLSQTSFEDIASISPETFWKYVKAFSEKARETGNSPILLVAISNHPKWLSDWLSHYQSSNRAIRPDDMTVSWRENMPNGYMGSLNEVEVYFTNISEDASFLMMKGAFERVQFHGYGGNRFVDVTTEQVKDSQLLINLKLTWQMEVDIKKLPAVKLRHHVQN